MAGMMQLATDDNNPDFVGAHNPDSKLHVRFYMRPMPNAFKTNLEKRPIFEDILYVEIHTPGNQLSIIDVMARDDHKARFPLHWAHFQNTFGKNADGFVGTPLAQWPLITPAQSEMLKALKFYTVESVAMASDSQISSIGMLAGMAPFSFREQAVMYLRVAKDTSFAAKQAEELKARDTEMAAMRKQIEDLTALVSQATTPTQIAKAEQNVKNAREGRA